MKLITLLLCVSGALVAQSTPIIQTETHEVLVDAIVTGKNGAYVHDLTAKDFHLSQDGKEQAIKGFSVESASASPQPRSLVLFFDETSMEPRDQAQVRQAAASFIDAQAGPDHMMAIMTFNGSAHIVQSFTNNAGRLKDALNQASFHGLAPGSDADNAHDPSRAEEQRAMGRANGSTLATSLGVRNMLRSLGDLGRSLGVLPGRKIVIVFTGTLPSTTDPRAEMRDAVDAANKSGVAFYPVDVRPVFMQTDLGDAPTPQSRVPSYTPRGGGPGGGAQGDTDALNSPIPDSSSGGQQVLSGLASGTGGVVVRNTSDLLGGLQNIGQEQEQYYTLSYVAPESKEGACHSLRVKVGRKGTTVRSRTSYCSSKSIDLLAGTAASKELEQHAAAPQAGDIAASIELPYLYIAPNVARVHMAMEIQADALKFENKKGKLHAELNFLGVAAGADGEVRARFSDALKLDFDNTAQMQSLKGKSLHYEKEFKIVPGQYTFTIAFSQGDASFGKLQVPLAIEPWMGGFGMSGLVLSRETHPAADLGLAVALDSGTPLVAQGAQVVPSGSGQFSKSEPAFFYFEVYGPAAQTARVRLRVLDRKTGEQKWDGGVSSLTAQNNAGRLPVDSLAPGTYLLEVIATDSGGKEVKRTADFEID
jgi:VWFA-related protein